MRDGEQYRVEVRAVDAYGQVSEPGRAVGTPGPEPRWQDGLTGLLDEFPDDRTLLADRPGSRWHLSGYRGCVGLGRSVEGEVGLPIDLGCGADEAVLRARAPLRLGPDGVLGRFAVLTDAAGPGGRLTMDLVPGPADRIGSGRRDDPALLPAGTVRTVVDDVGARVVAGSGLDVLPGAPSGVRPGPRGAGALHLVEVLVTTGGVRVRQDGVEVASAPVVPRWREAYALVGIHAPPGRRARVHVAGAGFSGAASADPRVLETPVNLSTRQVLDPAAEAPSVGTVRRPLATAESARFVVTMVMSAGMDVAGARVQVGTWTLPARQAVPGPPPAPGAAVTVVADVPPELLGPSGPDPLTPLVVRAPGAGEGALVQESYLEVVPIPAAPTPMTTTQPARTDRPRATTDAMPTATVTLGDSVGRPLPTTTVTPQGRLLLLVTLNGSTAQWDTGGLEGVQGFQLWLDGRLAASLPTSTATGAPGGTYPIPVGLTGRARGEHTVEVRVVGTTGTTSSTLTHFTTE
ncbi:hypothetical protein V5P93_005007 [Actinokineospora auranticolor]|nr:hypothetical protein [Actinokineospora auranticolor]